MDILYQSIFPLDENLAMRERLVKLYVTAKHSTSVIWAIEIARRIIKISGVDFSEDYEIIAGLALLFSYMNLDPKAMPLLADNLKEVKSLKIDRETITPELLRATGLKIHASVFDAPDVVKRLTTQVIAQAISSPFLHDQCLNCSDFAIKAIITFFPNNPTRVHEERVWQFHCLSSVINRMEEKHLKNQLEEVE